MLRTFFSAVFLLVFAAVPAAAHPGVHERIDEVTRKIDSSPEPELLVRRAELRISHGDLSGARADLRTARRLSPDLLEVDLVTGLLELEAERPAAAQVALGRFLKKRPHHADALVMRARARTQLGNHRGAAADLHEAVARAPTPRPDWFMRLADAHVADEKPAAALESLDLALGRLGNLVVLVEKAVEISAGNKRWDAALDYAAKLDARLLAAPTWQVRLGDLHEAAGRISAAREHFRDAIAGIDRLPDARRRTPAMQALRKRAVDALARDLP